MTVVIFFSFPSFFPLLKTTQSMSTRKIKLWHVNPVSSQFNMKDRQYNNKLFCNSQAFKGIQHKSSNIKLKDSYTLQQQTDLFLCTF